ncbi:hypothetical protein LYZ89_22035, partial [Xanthomonas hortorum pv. vitians]|uniref:hypothetical protein n=1 Tax=Xanthomonas hortorum TaxID=56454 RepID=UPI001F258A92
SRLELHGIDTHHATSLASGDSSIHPARRRSCDRRLMVRANQEKFWHYAHAQTTCPIIAD